jgi:colanic acid/amylovoran biosynthesis protein
MTGQQEELMLMPELANANVVAPGELYNDQGGVVCLFGAALDTGNLGVSALSLSLLAGLSSHNLSVTVFDYSRGHGMLCHRLNGLDIRIARCGAFHTRRLYRPESLWNIRISGRLWGLRNVGANTIRLSNAVLDISGGDSFTDLYGKRRYQAVTLPKIIALEQKKPLILLPQTYGPFKTTKSNQLASKIVRASRMAWARDERSFEVLKDLLGNSYNPDRHRAGVDVAFGLPVTRPAEEKIAGFGDWFEDARNPLAGLNVSGLLLNQPDAAAKQYGFKADYREVILSFLRRLLRESDARILLVPHVVSQPGHYESDIEACEAIAAALRRESGDRIAVAPVVQDPCEVKWIIARCGWFCGTRMHSTIAALSSGVPTAAISYSPKTLGVFESCEQGAHVADPCQLTTEEVVDCLWRSWLDRESARETLKAALPGVLQRVEMQMDDIAAACIKPKASRATRVG